MASGVVRALLKPKATPRVFSLQEALIALLRAQGIHEGHWQVGVRFINQTQFVRAPTGDLCPSDITMVQAILAIPVQEPNPASVDAAEVNPAPSGLYLPDGVRS